MFELILIAFLSYRNGIRAKLIGKNGLAWGLLTTVAFFLSMVIGFYVVVFAFCRGDVNLGILQSNDVNAQRALIQQLVDSFSAHPIRLITVDAFGFGGYLLIRYILERNIKNKEPEVRHWMDKLGDQP